MSNRRLSEMLSYGSLFTGIGGIDLGLDRSGMTCAYQVEKDSECRALLKERWPLVPKYKDISQVTGLPKTDVLAGGFPCQDVSNAQHNNKGLDGERSGLWFEFFRIIKQVRPQYVIVENVEALRYKGRGLGTILRNLAEIGYDAEWCVLRANHFGAPHKRARIWVVAYPYKDSEPERPQHDEAFVLQEPTKANWRDWPDPPCLMGMANGLPGRLDKYRRRQLGNSVVPQMAEFVGRCISQHHKNECGMVNRNRLEGVSSHG